MHEEHNTFEFQTKILQLRSHQVAKTPDTKTYTHAEHIFRVITDY